MISRSFNISEFIAEVKGYSPQDIIFMADAEATAAERESYKTHIQKDRARMRTYAMEIKDIILYMRHGILTRITRALDLSTMSHKIGEAPLNSPMRTEELPYDHGNNRLFDH